MSLEKIRSFFQHFAPPIFYLTNDPLKAVGLEQIIPNYHIVCIDDSPLVDYLQKRKVKIFCLQRKLGKQNQVFRSSLSLLKHPLTIKYIKSSCPQGTVNLLFFKPLFEPQKVIPDKSLACRIKVLNPSFTLNRLFEDKLKFYDLLEGKFPLPPGKIADLSKASFKSLVEKYGERLVVQLARGWAGETTFLVSSQKELKKLQKRFLRSKVKITRYIPGETLITNACIVEDKVLSSFPFYQISRIPELTTNWAETSGNSWTPVPEPIKTKVIFLTKKLGEFMASEGYRGFFGPDWLVNESGDVWLSEINARLTASSSMFTQLQILAGEVPLLVWHLLEFLGEKRLLTKIAKEKGYEPRQKFASQLVIRNQMKNPILIKGELLPGVYTFKKGRLSFVREGYLLQDIRKREEEFLLFPAASGVIVNPKIEYLRIQTFYPAVKGGKLSTWAKDAVTDARGKMEILTLG